MYARKHPKNFVGRQLALAAFIADVEMRTIAKELNLSRQSLYLRGIGKRRWQSGELAQVADLLGVTERFLLGKAGNSRD